VSALKRFFFLRVKLSYFFFIEPKKKLNTRNIEMIKIDKVRIDRELYSCVIKLLLSDTVLRRAKFLFFVSKFHILLLQTQKYVK
jgi:hypothetical protein